MPPEVAQAPIVTRNLHCLRISLIRSRVVRRGDRAFDQTHVIGSGDLLRAGFQEVGDLHRFGDRQQLVFAIKQRELAAVARGEFEDGQFRFVGHQKSSRCK